MGQRRSLWRCLDKQLVAWRLRALEASFQAHKFYEMSDYFDACIDLIEFSEYVLCSFQSTTFQLTPYRSTTYSLENKQKATIGLLKCIAYGGKMWRALSVVLHESSYTTV
jgi:hypothetical protein